jgi:hypothetical protein
MGSDNLLDRLIGQLDTLIPFLAISHQDIFDLIQKEKYVWFPEKQLEAFPDTYDIYQTQIVHSAFLLGYSYSEVFLADLVREIFKSNPKILPSDKQLRYSEILEVQTHKDIITIMIEREISAIFYPSVEKIIEYFEKKLNLKWTDEQKEKVILASLMRNCIIHNASRADARLSQVSGHKSGEHIKLSPSDVHGFGITMRGLARSLYNQANQRYFRRV